jgi:hypothetical protein
MPRRPAAITQADIARVIRAAKQAGALEVTVQVGDRSKITIRFAPSTGTAEAVDPEGEIVL